MARRISLRLRVRLVGVGIVGIVASGVSVLPLDAYAQSPGQDAATANALYKEGVALMEQKRFADACPKLVESQRLDPGGGTLVAIALCHEGEGKLATAWADWDVALTRARADRHAQREAAALAHIKALEPRLPRFNLGVAADVPGLVVKRDGAEVGKAQLGVALPVDPGDHVIEASAPKKKPWRATVGTQGEGKTVNVVVPPLEDDAAVPAPSAEPPKAPPPATSSPPPPPSQLADGSTQRTVGLVVGGVGIAGLAVGSFFGLKAMSKWSDAQTSCPKNVCPSQVDKAIGDDAASAGTVSTIAMGIGAAGVVAGAILFFTAPRPRSSTALELLPTVGARAAGLTLRWSR